MPAKPHAFKLRDIGIKGLKNVFEKCGDGLGYSFWVVAAGLLHCNIFARSPIAMFEAVAPHWALAANFWRGKLVPILC